jgi:hypothetical protein
VAILDEEALIEILKYEVEEGNHLNGEVDELKVELAIVILQVGSLNFENGVFQQL